VLVPIGTGPHPCAVGFCNGGAFDSRFSDQLSRVPLLLSFTPSNVEGAAVNIALHLDALSEAARTLQFSTVDYEPQFPVAGPSLCWGF
jgi:hypothetical protein